MNFTDSIKNFWTKYAVFTGRASRSEYWWAILHLVIISLVVSILDFALNPNLKSDETGPLGWVFSLATLIPSLSLLVRRFHDVGISGKIVAALYAPVAVMVAVGLYIGVEAASMGYDAIENPSDSMMGLLVILGLLIFISFGSLITAFVVSLLPSKNDNKWGARPAHAPAYAAPTAAPVVPMEEIIPVKPAPKETKQEDVLEKLEKLNELKEKGLITDAEFKSLKKKELGL